jgi:hypothetical protein
MKAVQLGDRWNLEIHAVFHISHCVGRQVVPKHIAIGATSLERFKHDSLNVASSQWISASKCQTRQNYFLVDIKTSHKLHLHS